MPTHQQLQKLQDALIGAFPNKSLIEQMLYFQLGKNLNEITRDSDLQDITFKLVQTAEAQGWLFELVRAARKKNPGNLSLEASAKEILPEFQIGKPLPEKPKTPGTNSDTSAWKSKIVNNLGRLTIGVGTAALILIGTGVVAYRLTNYTPLVCVIHKVPNGKYSYSGSTTWALFREKVEHSIQDVCPEFELTFIPNPPGESTSTFGIKRLLQGQGDFSISSRNILDKEYQEAKTAGGFELKQIPVAIDATAVAVNHSLNLPKSGLTLSELKGILTGKITNWNQLGVSGNLPITVYQGKNSSYSQIVKQEVLNGEEYVQKLIRISTITDGIQKLKNDKGGIFISSAAHLVSQCGIKALPLGRQQNKLISPYQLPFVPPDKCTEKHKNQPNALAFRRAEYPLTNRLFVILKQDGDRSQQSGEAFANLLLTSPRQEIIEKAGFVKFQE